MHPDHRSSATRSWLLGLAAVFAALGLAGCAGSGDSQPTEPNTSSPERVTSSVQPIADGRIAQNLQSPWSILRLPDGAVLVTQRDSGTILSMDPKTGATQELLAVPDLERAGEGGLMGLAASADGATVFAMYTADDGNRVVRMGWDGVRLGAPRTILGGIPRAQYHDGGRLAVAQDGNLFVATGDAGDPESAQDLSSPSGKILKITPEGDAASGNPFTDSPVYSLGHRNVQGLTFDDEGRLWASEFGSDEFDELNLIRPGKNYGWPLIEGPSDDPKYVSPAAWWSSTSEASPSGITFASGNIWVAALRGEALWQVPVADGQAGQPIARFQGEYGRLRDVVAGPGDTLWILTNNTDSRGVPKEGDDQILRAKLARGEDDWAD